MIPAARKKVGDIRAVLQRRRVAVSGSGTRFLFCLMLGIARSAGVGTGACAILGGTAALAQETGEFNIAIPALPLSEALKQVAQQTGEDILFIPETVAGVQTKPLIGKMGAQHAVELLIADSQLEVLAGGPGSLVVRRVPANNVQPPSLDASLQRLDPIERVVVTGTSIRGIAPIGSSLMTVGRDMIDETAAVHVSQMLKLVPAVTDFGGSGIGQLPGISYYSPTIHSLGASGSNSTLVLIDGHRMPEGGNQHVLPDPNIIPAIAVERIEVLADGSSSVYGSDAVAGVVNFITRKRYEGFEADIQAGFGANYGTQVGGALYGKTWDTGWVMAAYGYSRTANPSVDYRSRPYTVPDKTQLAIARGLLPAGTAPTYLTDGATFFCGPATIQMAGESTIFPSATGTAAVANLPQNSPCPYGPNAPGSYNGTGAETRNTALIKFSQDIGSRFTISSDIDFSYRDTYSHVSAPVLQATAFQTGPQANPFYQVPPGYSGGATSETIRWDATDLIGYGLNDNHSEDWYATLNEEYQLSDRLRLTASQMIANDNSVVITNADTLNTSAATLALNGTTNTAGSTSIPSIAGTDYILLNMPLTIDNALDVWSPSATNRTSAAVRAAIADNRQIYRGTYQLQDFHLGADGDIMALPAGTVRFAIGLEYFRVIQDSENDFPGNFGPLGQSATTAYYPLSRSVYSHFGELDIPIVGPAMGVPLMRQFSLDLSGRYDSYSDVGPTTNPKIAMEWETIHGLKLRANWSTSFVAPSQRSVGNPELDGLNSLSRVTPNTTSATVPAAVFPNIVGDPGCPVGSTLCQINSIVSGVYRYTGNPDTKPEKGRAWNLGLDFTPDFVPGLDLSVTMFDNRFIGGVTSPPLNSIINNASLNYRLKFCNPGAPCTQQQIGDFIGNVPITQALPSTVYYLYDQSQTNVLNLSIRGLDISASYAYPTRTAGNFTASIMATDFLAFDENYNGSPQFSVLNTSGYNTSFPSIGLQARLMLAWEYAGFSTSLFTRYTGGYRNWSSATINPVITTIVNGQSVPTGGGDPVAANITFDMHFGYELAKLSTTLGASQIYLDISNLLDTDPPFYNTSTTGNANNSTVTGFDPYGASNLGRVISIGFRVKY